jgi:hypothetical protein
MKNMLLNLGALPMTAGIASAREAALPRLAVAPLDTSTNDQKIRQDAATIRNLVESRMADIRQYRI